MTTIVYCAGIMAADSRAYSGNRDYMGSKAKIERLEDGTLIGCSSTIVGGGEAVRAWYKEGADPKAELPKSFSFMVAKPNGELFTAVDIAYLSGPLEAPFMGIGTGGDIALGCMAAGKNAIEAVRLTCRWDIWSDLPIYAASHAGPMPRMRVDLPPDMFRWLD